MDDHDPVPTPASIAFDVDAGILDDVLEAIGVEEVRASVQSVVADIGHLIGRLTIGGGPEALDAIGREAHHLGGGCRSMGFAGIASVCERIEADARARVDQRWPAYAIELAQQRQALNEWWSTAPAAHGFRRSRPPE